MDHDDVKKEVLDSLDTSEEDQIVKLSIQKTTQCFGKILKEWLDDYYLIETEAKQFKNRITEEIDNIVKKLSNE